MSVMRYSNQYQLSEEWYLWEFCHNSISEHVYYLLVRRIYCNMYLRNFFDM